jgi:hypothetical protein
MYILLLPVCQPEVNRSYEKFRTLSETSSIICIFWRCPDGLEIGWLGRMASSFALVLELKAISRWSHWVTPKLMKYHYDTLFFIAMMQSAQSCMPDSRETPEGIINSLFFFGAV